MPDAQSILTPLQIPASVKADAWDAVQNAATSDDLTARLRKLPLADSVRADLWDSAQARLGDTLPKSTIGFLGNVVTSTGRQLGNVATALAHPLTTAKGLADVAAGGINALTGDAGAADESPEARESDAKFQALAGQA